MKPNLNLKTRQKNNVTSIAQTPLLGFSQNDLLAAGLHPNTLELEQA